MNVYLVALFSRRVGTLLGGRVAHLARAGTLAVIALTACALAAGQAAPAAVGATPGAPEPAQKEVAVSSASFARGVPLPAWADVAPLPPPPAVHRSVDLRLEDTHLLVAEKPVLLVNAAQQVNDAAALGQIGQVSVPFVPQYQRLVLHKALVLRGTESLDRTAAVEVRFLQREVGLEQGIYSGVITASMLFPDVRVGDTLVLQYSIEGANPIFGRRFMQHLPWQRPAPVQLRRVTLNLPADRPVQWRFNGDGALPKVTPTESTAKGMRRLRFEERDVAAIELEPAEPRGAMPLAWLQFSEFADWTEVSRWADGLFPADAPLPDELLPLIQRWLRLPTASERASQALQWVQNEIRYVSVSLGESSHRPHSPAEVLRNRYGDCKDKSFLLMRLLQAMGLPAHAVLASLSAPQGASRVLASPLAFDHVVVQLHLDDRDFYLDATRLGQRGPLARMGQGLEEASVLVIAGNATLGPTVIRSPNRAELFTNDLVEHFRLPTFDGEATLEAVQQWTGLLAEGLRLTAARLDRPRLERSVLEALLRRYPGATLAGAPELVDDIDRNRITLRTSFKIPKLATPNPGDGSWLVRIQPNNLANLLVVPPSPQRSMPLAVPGFPNLVTYRTDVQWPDNVSGLLDPSSRRIHNPAFDAEVGRSFRGNVSTLSLRIEPRGPRVEARDVPTMVADARSLDRDLAPMVVTREMLKSGGGFLGLSKKSLADTLKARAEATVERSTRVIDGGQLSGDDLAAALCLRSEAQGELGRLDESLKDAVQAVQKAPETALAWACQGNAHWRGADFAAAESDFTHALTLGAAAGEVYMRRGQARFYGGRLEPAADDFAKAVAAQSGNPTPLAHARLWQAFTLKRLGRPEPPDLPSATMATSGPEAAWPLPALALFAGRTTPEQLIDQLSQKLGDDRDLALTEAWFFVGEYRLGLQQNEAAKKAFENARAPGVTPYVEYAAAGFELQRLARP